MNGPHYVHLAPQAVAAVQGLQGQALDTSCVNPPERGPGLDGQIVVGDPAHSGTQREGSNAPNGGASSSARGTSAIPDDLSSSVVVAACMKHFAGYQASRSGYDRAPSWIPEVRLRHVSVADSVRPLKLP